MDHNVGGVPAPVEAQVALEAARRMFRVNVRQQRVVVRGDDVTVGTLEPALPAIGVVLVEVLVQLQMLLHEEPVVCGEGAVPGHTLVQAVQRDVLEHTAAVLLVLGGNHVRPGFQPHRVDSQIGHGLDVRVGVGTDVCVGSYGYRGQRWRLSG